MLGVIWFLVNWFVSDLELLGCFGALVVMVGGRLHGGYGNWVLEVVVLFRRRPPTLLEELFFRF